MNQVSITVPELPESIANAKVVTWHKKIGDIVQQDEILVDIETEKVILEVPAVINGILESILKIEGEIVTNREILGFIKKSEQEIQNHITDKTNIPNKNFHSTQTPEILQHKKYSFSPSIRKSMAKNNNLNLKNVSQKNTCSIINNKHFSNCNNNTNDENVRSNLHSITKIPMTNMRKTIAERLLKTKNNTAMLTTFNEVNMQSIINMRNMYCDHFQDKHGIKLGFMSFFVKAVIESLKKFPDVNAKIEKNDIIYYNYFDINIAVSTKKGLVTPVLKDANLMNMSTIEKKIQFFKLKGDDGKLTLSDLTGGNFTITNGGIFGSLMSTPIINPPQSAILGMHAIKDRPMAVNGKIKILPMMYLALSYDHRLIDGKEAVGFLNMIKNILEDFSRILLDI